jgi:hypothetical protein
MKGGIRELHCFFFLQQGDLNNYTQKNENIYYTQPSISGIR